MHIAARSADLLAKAQDEMRARHGATVHSHVCDLRAKGAVKQLADACANVDVLVNNAGDIPGGNIELMDEERWR